MNMNLSDKYWTDKLQTDKLQVFWHSTFDHRFILSILNDYFQTAKQSEYSPWKTPAPIHCVQVVIHNCKWWAKGVMEIAVCY